MNDRYPFLESERDLISFINGLHPDRSELVDRNRRLAGLNAQHRAAIRAARSDRAIQFRTSIARLGAAKFVALALFSVAAANLLSQHWTTQQIRFDGWLLLAISCAALILVDRWEAGIGRWIFNPCLGAEFRPTEAAVNQICHSHQLSRRTIAITFRGNILR